MRTKDDRIDLFCDLFELNSRTTAGRKVNKALSLKKYEQFLSYFTNKQISDALYFVNSNNSSLAILITKMGLSKFSFDKYYEEYKKCLIKNSYDIDTLDGVIYKYHTQKYISEIILIKKNFDEDLLYGQSTKLSKITFFSENAYKAYKKNKFFNSSYIFDSEMEARRLKDKDFLNTYFISYPVFACITDYFYYLCNKEFNKMKILQNDPTNKVATHIFNKLSKLLKQPEIIFDLDIPILEMIAKKVVLHYLLRQQK